MTDPVRIVALGCLTLLGVTAAFTFPEAARTATIGTIIGLIAAIVEGTPLVAWIRHRKKKDVDKK